MTTRATIKSELYKVNLSLADGPSIHDAFGERAQITGVGIVYSDGKPTAIRFETETDPDLFADPMDLDKAETWPEWLRELVDDYRPSR